MSVSVFSDVACHLGEGPSYHAERGLAFWFDILERKLLQRPLAGGPLVTHDLPFHASVAATVDGGTQLLAGTDGLYLRDLGSGVLRQVHPYWDPVPRTRTNDGRVHPCGALWISTMSWTFEAGQGTIWIYAGGRLRPIVTGLAIPNAICFSADGATGYFADSKAGVLYRIALDPLTGVPTGERQLFAEVTDGGPDGAVVDADGLLWNARWGGAAVDAYAPDGRRLKSIALPARQTSCPCFVGAAADRMIVTSAYEGYDAEAQAADPAAGQTFLIDIPFNGRLDARVNLA